MVADPRIRRDAVCASCSRSKLDAHLSDMPAMDRQPNANHRRRRGRSTHLPITRHGQQIPPHGPPRVIRHKVTSAPMASQLEAHVAPRPTWLPRLRPVLEEACGALLAAAVVYVLAVALGYVRTPDGAIAMVVIGNVIILYVMTAIMSKHWPAGARGASRYRAIRWWAHLPARAEPVAAGLLITLGSCIFVIGMERDDRVIRLNLAVYERTLGRVDPDWMWAVAGGVVVLMAALLAIEMLSRRSKRRKESATQRR